MANISSHLNYTKTAETTLIDRSMSIRYHENNFFE